MLVSGAACAVSVQGQTDVHSGLEVGSACRDWEMTPPAPGAERRDYDWLSGLWG
jgi:hypothetical protein